MLCQALPLILLLIAGAPAEQTAAELIEGPNGWLLLLLLLLLLAQTGWQPGR
jgi:hypothetical protein